MVKSTITHAPKKPTTTEIHTLMRRVREKVKAVAKKVTYRLSEHRLPTFKTLFVRHALKKYKMQDAFARYRFVRPWKGYGAIQ